MKTINEYILYEIENLTDQIYTITIFGILKYKLLFRTKNYFQEEILNINNVESLFDGSGYNIPIALSELGSDCNLLTRVGDDENCNLILNYLKSKGVKTSGIRKYKKGKLPFDIFIIDKSEKIVKKGHFKGVLENFTFDSFNYERFIENSQLIYIDLDIPSKRIIHESPYLLRYAKKKNILTAISLFEKPKPDINPYELLKIFKESNLLFTSETLFTKHLSFKAPNITSAINNLQIDTVVLISKNNIKVAHINRTYKLENQFNLLLSEHNSDFIYNFQGAFMHFYLKRLPIEITSVLAFAYSVEGRETGIKKIKNFIKLHKIIDSENNRIVIK